MDITWVRAFVNDDALWTNMEAASKESGEKLWRMPLGDAYDRQIDSDIADDPDISLIERVILELAGG